MKVLHGRGLKDPMSKEIVEKVWLTPHIFWEYRNRPLKVQPLGGHGRTWGLMACFEGMPALVLDFYPNGNINEFLRRQDPKPNDDIKLTLVLLHIFPRFPPPPP